MTSFFERKRAMQKNTEMYFTLVAGRRVFLPKVGGPRYTRVSVGFGINLLCPKTRMRGDFIKVIADLKGSRSYKVGRRRAYKRGVRSEVLFNSGGRGES